MPQMLLPIFTPGVKRINDLIGFEVKDGRVYYLHGILPVFSHDVEDLNSFRFITSQLALSGNVKQIEISKAFGIPYITVKRNVALLRKEGPNAFFKKKKGRSAHILTEKVKKKIQTRLDKGMTVNAIARELNIKAPTIRKAIQQGKLKRKSKSGNKKSDKSQVTTKSHRNTQDNQCSMGQACTREEERFLASIGKLAKAEPQFEPAADVKSAGVLFALPALLANGLLKESDTYFSLPSGYYGLETIIMVLAFAALLRIQSIEQIRNCDPGEMGKLVGLDRIPEVKVLREKIRIMSEQGDPGQWSRDLAVIWMQDNTELAGTLYVDGHVRPYYGKQTKLPRRFMSRQRLCLRGVTDYWINDALGQPFFVVPRTVNSGLLAVLREDIVPCLINDVPNQPDAPMLKDNTYLSRFGIVFDREGYSPGFMKEMWGLRVCCYTYKKYVKDQWPDDEFIETQVTFPNGENQSMKISERGTFYANEKLWVREIRKLTDSGHQTVVITTDYINEAGKISGLMFSRWSQENYFKYMMKHYGIDRLIDYDLENMDDTIKIVNPVYRQLDGQIRSLNAKLSRKKAQHYDLMLQEDIDEKKVKDFVHKKAQCQEAIDELEQQITDLKQKRKNTDKHIAFSELPKDEKFDQLKKSGKQFMDTVKMISYRAETAIVTILREYIGKKDEARSIARQIFATDADMDPDYQNGVLNVVLHNMTNPLHNRYVVKLCDILNDSETFFPGTNLRMIFNSVSNQFHVDREF
jgi:hypothetical protein